MTVATSTVGGGGGAAALPALQPPRTRSEPDTRTPRNVTRCMRHSGSSHQTRNARSIRRRYRVSTTPWRRTCRIGAHRATSEDLLDGVNRPLGANLSDADREQTIDERVLLCGRLEPWHRAEIVVRVVAHAGERHVNQAAVVSLERDAQVESEGSVAPSGDPVAAAGEHLA